MKKLFCKSALISLSLSFSGYAQAGIQMNLEGSAAEEVMNFVSSRIGTQQQESIDNQIKEIAVSAEKLLAICNVPFLVVTHNECSVAGNFERNNRGSRVYENLSEPTSNIMIAKLNEVGIPTFRGAEYRLKDFEFRIQCSKVIDINLNENAKTNCQINVTRYTPKATEPLSVIVE